MPPSPLASSSKAPDLPTPPRPSRGVKRRLPPDLTPLVERTLSFKSSANGSSRDSRRGSASTNGITSSGGQSAAVSVSPDKSNRKRASRIVSNDGNGRALPSQEPETAMEESQKRTADLFSGWREEYFESECIGQVFAKKLLYLISLCASRQLCASTSCRATAIGDASLLLSHPRIGGASQR